jgi:PEP-CTERM motif
MKAFLTAAALAAGVASPAFAAELLTNGNFETGTFAGWSSNVQSGSNGNRFISTPGANAPASGFATSANGAGGNFYAVTDQNGGGAYSLTQLFTIASGTTSATLTFQMFNQNQAGTSIINPAGLDYLAGGNQHARVDILTAGASAFTNNPGDIVANLYLGDDGSGQQPYINYSFNLLSLAGITAGNSYQIRFGQVDNQFFFQQGVDNVSITTAAVPEPASWALMIAGFGLVGGAMRRRTTVVRFAA